MRPWKFTTLVFACGLAAPTSVHAASNWQAPTPEELSMTAEPKAPGAVAIYLDREETDKSFSPQSTIEYSARIKVLTEAGKSYGNVKMAFPKGWVEAKGLQCQTIHKDGTVIPCTDKMYAQTMAASSRGGAREVVMELPDVQVGSILEYRYTITINTGVYIPRWYLQSNLYARRMHYQLHTYSMTGGGYLLDRNGDRAGNLIYTSVLPVGATLKKRAKASGQVFNGHELPEDIWDLNITDVPAIPKASHLPPLHGMIYRVQFFYTNAPDSDTYWKETGQEWSRTVDEIAKPGPQVLQAASGMKQGTEEQTLRAIYAAVQGLTNTNYSSAGGHAAVDQSGPPKSSDAVWTRRRGNAKQITRLFVALARAAKLNAYVMDVTNRTNTVFAKEFLSLGQLNGEVAIVRVDGVEQYFDPGTQDCPYGQLQWERTAAGGLRQTDTGTAIAYTPMGRYVQNVSQRTADLNLAVDGSVDGTVLLAYRGEEAMALRQSVANLDVSGATKHFEDNLRAMLPDGVSVHLMDKANLQDPEKPLLLKYSVQGVMASSESKYMMFPSQIFLAKSKQEFVSANRKYGVYFHYPYTTIDHVAVHLSAGLQVESLPQEQISSDPQVAAYRAKVEQSANTVTLSRVFVLNKVYIEVKDYPTLHDFYGKVNASDTTPALFVRAVAGTP